MPKRIQIDDKKNCKGIELYHLVDSVHLKPLTQVDLVLRLRQPRGRLTENGKQLTYLKTARDQIMFRVLKSCLKSVVTETIGYEASVAGICYKFQSLEDIGVRITIRGYNDKVLDFAKIYLDTLIAQAEPQSFDKSVLINSMEKKRECYSNSNLEADIRGRNNRNLFLCP